MYARAFAFHGLAFLFREQEGGWLMQFFLRRCLDR